MGYQKESMAVFGLLFVAGAVGAFAQIAVSGGFASRGEAREPGAENGEGALVADIQYTEFVSYTAFRTRHAPRRPNMRALTN
jgi:hypothetical protein